MALIKCPECGKEISDKAQMCPNCGFAMSTIDMPIKKTLVQLDTAPDKRKKYKIQQLIFGPMWAIGSIGTLGSLFSGSDAKITFWFFVATIGLGGYLYGSVGNWLAKP